MRQTEAEFQRAVVELAQLRGWLVAHFRPAMMRDGRLRTPVAADGAGFPDLVLAKAGVGVLYVELKVGQNSTSRAQRRWHETLDGAGAEVHVWRPRDWPHIERALARRPSSAACAS
ncbi:MAG TPA: VRR-NUC domain-containing protein [Miltoncostaeaceae bacterium]|nr:VRR-NUC domain-containing protein [Miltoncostaeaceae bacterium]